MAVDESAPKSAPQGESYAGQNARTVVLALSGVVIGVVAALGLMRLLRTLLFEVSTNDVTTFVVVAGGLFVIALLACYLPARRATKVDPLVALRYE